MCFTLGRRPAFRRCGILELTRRQSRRLVLAATERQAARRAHRSELLRGLPRCGKGVRTAGGDMAARRANPRPTGGNVFAPVLSTGYDCCGVAISEEDLAELRADMGVLNERRWAALEWEMPADEAYFFPGSVSLRFRLCFDGSFEVALRREEH